MPIVRSPLQAGILAEAEIAVDAMRRSTPIGHCREETAQGPDPGPNPGQGPMQSTIRIVVTVAGHQDPDLDLVVAMRHFELV